MIDFNIRQVLRQHVAADAAEIAVADQQCGQRTAVSMPPHAVIAGQILFVFMRTYRWAFPILFFVRPFFFSDIRSLPFFAPLRFVFMRFFSGSFSLAVVYYGAFFRTRQGASVCFSALKRIAAAGHYAVFYHGKFLSWRVPLLALEKRAAPSGQPASQERIVLNSTL